MPSQGASGGILVGWDATLSSKLDDYKGNFSLSLKFKLHVDCFEQWFTRVYEPCSSTLNVSFIDELCHLQSIMGSKWVIGGEFNIIRFTHEHSNRSSVSPIMTKFNNFIASTNLIDFSPNNCLCTWSKFQQNATMVKLDRFLISPGCESLIFLCLFVLVRPG